MNTEVVQCIVLMRVRKSLSSISKGSSHYRHYAYSRQYWNNLYAHAEALQAWLYGAPFVSSSSVCWMQMKITAQLVPEAATYRDPSFTTTSNTFLTTTNKTMHSCQRQLSAVLGLLQNM